jgi:hypothetical protein
MIVVSTIRLPIKHIKRLVGERLAARKTAKALPMVLAFQLSIRRRYRRPFDREVTPPALREVHRLPALLAEHARSIGLYPPAIGDGLLAPDAVLRRRDVPTLYGRSVAILITLGAGARGARHRTGRRPEVGSSSSTTFLLISCARRLASGTGHHRSAVLVVFR